MISPSTVCCICPVTIFCHFFRFKNTITLTRCHKQKLNGRGSDERQKDGEECDIKNCEVQVNLKTLKKLSLVTAFEYMYLYGALLPSSIVEWDVIFQSSIYEELQTLYALNLYLSLLKPENCLGFLNRSDKLLQILHCCMYCAHPAPCVGFFVFVWFCSVWLAIAHYMSSVSDTSELNSGDT